MAHFTFYLLLWLGQVAHRSLWEKLYCCRKNFNGTNFLPDAQPTLGDRAFPVAAAKVWNSLPTTLTSQSSLLTFKQQLKTFLFEQSYP